MRVGGGRIVHKSRRAKKKNYIPLNINQRTIFHFWHGLMSFYTHAILSMKVIQCATRALQHWGWLWGVFHTVIMVCSNTISNGIIGGFYYFFNTLHILPTE